MLAHTCTRLAPTRHITHIDVSMHSARDCMRLFFRRLGRMRSGNPVEATAWSLVIRTSTVRLVGWSTRLHRRAHGGASEFPSRFHVTWRSRPGAHAPALQRRVAHYAE